MSVRRAMEDANMAADNSTRGKTVESQAALDHMKCIPSIFFSCASFRANIPELWHNRELLKSKFDLKSSE